MLRAYHIAMVPMLIYAASLWGVGLGGGYVLAFDVTGLHAAGAARRARLLVGGHRRAGAGRHRDERLSGVDDPLAAASQSVTTKSMKPRSTSVDTSLTRSF